MASSPSNLGLHTGQPPVIFHLHHLSRLWETNLTCD